MFGVRTIGFKAVIVAMLCAFTLVSAPAAANAADAVKLESLVFVERTEATADGGTRTVMKSPSDVTVVPGDQLLFITRFVNQGGQSVTGFTAHNRLPAPVRFVATDESFAEVSVDGAKSWGKLPALTMTVTDPATGATTTRPATPEDVTDVRWVLPAELPVGGKGELSYRAIVR